MMMLLQWAVKVLSWRGVLLAKVEIAVPLLRELSQFKQVTRALTVKLEVTPTRALVCAVITLGRRC
jgi:hypothetical protein